MNDIKDDVLICPICANNHIRPYKLGLVQCEECGVVLSPAIWRNLVNERMEEEWFGEHYQSRSSFWVRHFEAQNNLRTLARLARLFLPGQRLLEIGVGSGSFLQIARQQGYEVMGCDLSRPICERVRCLYDIPMHGESLAKLTGENRFDVIVMNHVLEHVSQPIDLLRDVYRLLAHGGAVHIAVPNIACWEASFSGWTSYEPYHLSYFSPQTLRRTVFASGLIIEHMTTRDSFSGWFLAVLRTILGVNQAGRAITHFGGATTSRASDTRSGIVENVYRLAMVCVGGGLLPLRLLQAKLDRGDELICIARKSPAWQINEAYDS